MDNITLTLTIVTIINSALGLLILFSPERQSSSKIYSLITLTTLSWIFCIIFYRLSNQENIVIWTRLLYISASLIASTFLFFTYLFPVNDKLSVLQKVAIFTPNLIIVILIIFGDTMIKTATVRYGTENSIYFGKLYFLYVVYILGYFNYAFFRIFNKYKHLAEDYQKRQAAFFLAGYFISATIAFATNLILPWFGYFTLNWMGQASTVFLVTFTTYAIIRHQLFNIKAVAAELFMGSLWILFLARTIVSTTSEDRVFNGGVLLTTVFLGIFLIRSILNEVKTREKIENLAKDLSAANGRLRELDQQKSEFVSLASHQLRGPLTAVKGYTSMLLDGDFGAVAAEAKDALEKIFESIQDLTIVVGDYLDVSRIEQGRMQYDFTNFDLRDLVATVVTELRPNVARAKLELNFDFDPAGSYMINADQGKIKQVIGNLIDNSIKYCPQGSIHVWLSHPAANIPANAEAGGPQSVSMPMSNKILLSVSDTGVGIHPDVLPRLFEKFTRAPDASKTNIMGTGLGLYVAKKIIEAHHGKIWAESPGAGKGSTFFIEFDVVNVSSPSDDITHTV